MDISRIIREGGNVTLNVTPADLREFAIQVADECMTALGRDAAREKYMNRGEAMEQLGVGAATLWRWERSGYLVPARWGKKVAYSLSDIARVKSGHNSHETHTRT